MCVSIKNVLAMPPRRRQPRRRRRRRRPRQSGAGLKDLKQALIHRAAAGATRIGKHIVNRKLGEMFLVPGLRPTYSTTGQLIKEELSRVGKELRRHPVSHLKTAFNLLRK